MIYNYDVIDILQETRGEDSRKILEPYLDGVSNDSYIHYYIEGEDIPMDNLILDIYKREELEPPEELLLNISW